MCKNFGAESAKARGAQSAPGNFSSTLSPAFPFRPRENRNTCAEIASPQKMHFSLCKTVPIFTPLLAYMAKMIQRKLSEVILGIDKEGRLWPIISYPPIELK